MEQIEKDKVLKEYLKRQKDSGFDQLKKIMNQVWSKRTSELSKQSLNKEISFKEQNFDSWFQDMNKDIQNKKLSEAQQKRKSDLIQKLLK